jgi:hypothetical protein
MKPILFSLIALFSVSPAFRQTLDACAVMQNAAKYANTVVQIKGIVHSSFEEFAITGSDCDQILKIWLAYPEQPEVQDDPPLKPQKMRFQPSRASKKFDNLLDHRGKCANVRVSATLRGFFQYRKETMTHSPDGSTAIVGFGHLGMYQYRLVILSVESAEGLPCSGSPAA